MASPNDTTYAIIREVVPGTTPATPAFKPFEATSDSLNFEGKLINSAIMRANRANVAAALVTQSGTGDLKTEARRDSTTDLLLESAIGGTFLTKVAKGGLADHSYTIEKKMLEGTGAMYLRSAGAYVNKFNFTVSPDNFGEFTFGFVNMKRTEAAAIIVGATYVAPTVQGPSLTGNDIGTITIGGQTGIYTQLDLSVEQGREAVHGLGSSSAVAVNVTPAPRMVKLSVTMLRQSIAIDAIKGTTVPVTITAGLGLNNGYTFFMPAMVANVPSDQSSGASGTVKVDLVAIHDNTLGSDISITQL